ncbi:hypothetical protein [Dyella psychrodurans]|uniref:Uncharacterized protein n=1 Tax=Dyella psychrodurans TaxID=1927960 RepID=A0A370XC78_9GAMM|nr:hypothetical protein [Dyella psychrodurans]RDS85887.1 hypothetical protein DWU99_01015 [Dyella psychrodurans]
MPTYGSKQEYEDAAKRMAVDLLKSLKPRAAADRAMDADALRQRIDALDPATPLKATLADWWLGISQTEGRQRRKIQPPPNPFTATQGSTLTATKGAIADWEAGWRAKESASLVGQRHVRSRLPAVHRQGQILQAGMLVLIEGNAVVGVVGDLPERLVTTTAFAECSVRSMSLEAALLEPWRDPTERRLWTERYRARNRLMEEEIERESRPPD